MTDTFDDTVFAYFADLVYRHSGILLGDRERGMLETRVTRRLRDLGLHSFAAYRERMKGNAGREEIPALLDAVTINYTYFFREESQFAALSAEVFPEIVARQEEAGGDRVRVWSAGCSSGEEPYSVAIAFHEAVENAEWYDFQILATDINRRVLHDARRGSYPEDRLLKIPQEWRLKYLVRDAETPPGHLRISPEIRGRVRFRRFNLQSNSDPLKDQFDVIFCRNVLMYFDAPTQHRLLGQFRTILPRGGYLFVGESDELDAAPPGFTRIAFGVFQRG
jgi:chemotaxis protein methyltransferase CheR